MLKLMAWLDNCNHTKYFQYKGGKPLNIHVLNIYHVYIELEIIGTKLEGETCGACFNPDANYDCGQCVEGLECVSHPDVELIPDLPATCKAPLGNYKLNNKLYHDVKK